MRSSSPFMARAVRAITGMARVASSRLSCRAASRPSMPGSWISIRIRSGCSARASVNPASASVALITVCPAVRTRNVARVMLAGLSSTIRTLATSGDHEAPRQGPLDFRLEALLVQFRLFHDRGHGAAELGTVLGRDLLAGDDQDGNAGRGG